MPAATGTSGCAPASADTRSWSTARPICGPTAPTRAGSRPAARPRSAAWSASSSTAAPRVPRYCSSRPACDDRRSYTSRMSPNPPRMVTVVLAVVLTVIGLALVFLPTGQMEDLVRQIGLPPDIQRTVVSWIEDRIVAWAALAASPIVLIVGSLVRGL